MVGLGMGSVSLIVAAFLTEGNAANLLVALGVTLAVGCLLLAVQVFYSVARERQSSLAEAGPRAPTLSNLTGLPNLDTRNVARPNNPGSENGDDEGSASIALYRAAYAAPQVGDLIAGATREVLAFVVSGRNFFQPQLHRRILQKLDNPDDQTVFRILALNHVAAEELAQARTSMMDMRTSPELIRRAPEIRQAYVQDFDTVREYTEHVKDYSAKATLASNGSSIRRPVIQASSNHLFLHHRRSVVPWSTVV
jgi:hypothetical protein